jgi:hypothetical protein
MDGSYIIHTKSKSFKSKKAFYNFCRSYFEKGNISFSIFGTPEQWYQKKESSAPYPIIQEYKGIWIEKTDIILFPGLVFSIYEIINKGV